jgi:orotate phosphoribosyltransferase
VLGLRGVSTGQFRRIGGGAADPEVGTASGALTDRELKVALRDAAYLEGDFVLRSGRRSRYYLDKYRFETRPDILAALGERIAAAVEPAAVRLAGPELGAVALAAAASLASGLPFVIVRKAAKEYGTSNRLEGVYEEGEVVCLVEDVVTSGGALLEAVVALREAGLVVRSAVCVVDREEGGIEALAREGVGLQPIFRASEVLKAAKTPAKPHG